jgi:hypothetical protein
MLVRKTSHQAPSSDNRTDACAGGEPKASKDTNSSTISRTFNPVNFEMRQHSFASVVYFQLHSIFPSCRETGFVRLFLCLGLERKSCTRMESVLQALAMPAIRQGFLAMTFWHILTLPRPNRRDKNEPFHFHADTVVDNARHIGNAWYR